MPKKRESLGRGLSAILSGDNVNIFTNKKGNTNQLTGETHEIDMHKITTNPFQPRIDFNKEKLHELAASIEELGIIQPIAVRKLNKDKYQIISGERRFRASQLAGLNRIPAFIRIANDQEMLEMALVENIQRQDLNPIEIALSYQRLINEVNLTQEECSERVGKNRSTVTNFLRLLKLPNEIQKGLINGDITIGHARALISIQNDNSQINIYHDIVANGYSVREVEQIAKEFSKKTYKRTSKEKPITTNHILTFNQQRIIYNLSKKLDAEIQIKQNKKGKGKGKLIIHFKNDADLAKTLDIINK